MDIGQLSTNVLLFLFLIAIIAGVLDTLAGGGGLIVLPALIAVGIPPLAALATNKLQGSMGTATSTYLMIRKKRIVWLDIRKMMIFAFTGAVLGTIAIQFISTSALEFVIPVVLLVIGLYFLLAPAPSLQNAMPKIKRKPYERGVVPLIGAYDGMFGPGTGSFFALAGVSLRGEGLVDATAKAKALNFSTNIASLGVFILAGQLVWVAGLSMMAGQLIGAWLGAHFLLKINPNVLKFIVVFMCFSMLLNYALSKGWLA